MKRTKSIGAGVVGVAEELVAAARALADDVDAIPFGEPVAYVYNPLSYARAPHETYLRTYGDSCKDVVLVGMNPGPFGMAQTGVPFGEVKLVSTWMKIDGAVGKPPREHKARPILGFACPRSEVSGARLWGAIAKKFPDAADFFAGHFVLNYCPLLFLEESGRNLTPDKLAQDGRRRLEAACDVHLARALAALAPHTVVGVGGYAAKRAAGVVDVGVRVGVLPHPSPASPAANAGWEKIARSAIRALRLPAFV